MIFVTVGHQLPFNRMIKTVDHWAGMNPGYDVFAQVGETPEIPLNIKYSKNLSPSDFDEKMRNAELIIAHAGTGTIIKALELKKPIFVMPRKASLGETRNDHQVHMANLFLKQGFIHAFGDETELEYLFAHEGYNRNVGIPRFASEQLISTIARFIDCQTS